MKMVFVAIGAILLAGCSFSEDYQAAIDNYSIAECTKMGGKVLARSTRTIDGTIDSRFSFQCVTEKGIEIVAEQIKNIPVQYWELDK